MMTQPADKEAWRAVLLSQILPGIGLLAYGSPFRGLLYFAGTIGLGAVGFWALMDRQIGVLPSAILIAAALIMYVGSMFHSFVIVRRTSATSKGIKSPYFAMFLSLLIPGIGHAYVGKYALACVLFGAYVLLLLFLPDQELLDSILTNMAAAIVSIAAFKTAQNRSRSSLKDAPLIALGLLTQWTAIDLWNPLSVVNQHGSSNYPAIYDGDVLLVRKYTGNNIRRMDFVGFRLAINSSSTYACKRVVAFSGEVVQISSDGLLVHNGNREVSDWRCLSFMAGHQLLVQGETLRWQVPENHVFVLGDNTTESTDSRHFGTIPVTAVEGIAVKRIWPLSRVGMLPSLCNKKIEPGGNQ